MKTNVQNEDNLLIHKVKNGDEGAFKFLMTKYYPRVYASLFAYTKSREDSEDLTQLTFIKVWQKIDSFRGDSAFFTWIYRIAINTAKNHLVAKGRRIQNSDIEPSEAESYAGGYEKQNFDTPDQEYQRQEVEKVVHDSIDGLPDDLKQAIILREVDGLSYEEIAEKMDCPIGTVRSRIFRARDAVDNALKPLLNNTQMRENYVR